MFFLRAEPGKLVNFSSTHLIIYSLLRFVYIQFLTSSKPPSIRVNINLISLTLSLILTATAVISSLFLLLTKTSTTDNNSGFVYAATGDERNLLSTFKEAAGVARRAPVDKSVTVQT